MSQTSFTNIPNIIIKIKRKYIKEVFPASSILNENRV